MSQKRTTASRMAPPAKRRKTQECVEEVTYDPDAREDYLSGFHKRKQQRIKHARDEAIKKEKALKIESRKHLREQRQRDLEAHVKAVNEMMKQSRGEHVSSEDDAEEEAEAEAQPPAEEPRHEDEYIDEEKYTTVTVEPMDNSDNKSEDEDKSDGSDGDGEGQKGRKSERNADGSAKKRNWTKEAPASSKPKKKKKEKFRYETKVERKAVRSKQRAKNSARAAARRDGN